MAKDKEFEKKYKAERIMRKTVRKAKRQLRNNGMCKCGINHKTDWHSCPYDEDMNGNYEKNCRCCSDCTHNCAMDI